MTERFADWRNIVEGIPADAVVVETEHTARVKYRGVEFLYQKRDASEWELDEIVGKVWIHMEQMNDSLYWFGFSFLDGGDKDERFCIDVRSLTGRARVVTTGWFD